MLTMLVQIELLTRNEDRAGANPVVSSIILTMQKLLEEFIREMLEKQKTYYHGTTSDAVPSIMSNGLRPDSDGVVYITSDRETAFLNGAMRTFNSKRRLDIEPVILIVKPISGLKNQGMGDATTGTIPASNISVSELTPDERDSFQFSLRAARRRWMR